MAGKKYKIDERGLAEKGSWIQIAKSDWDSIIQETADGVAVGDQHFARIVYPMTLPGGPAQEVIMVVSTQGPSTSLVLGAVGNGASIDVSDYRNHTIHITAADTPDSLVEVQQSIDGGTNWSTLYSSQITEVGVTEIAISNVAYALLRVNCPVATYGTGNFSGIIYSNN